MSKQYVRAVTTSRKKNYKVSIEEYKSANDMAQDCANRVRKEGGWYEPECGRWVGVKSYDEALEFLGSGEPPA